MPPGATPIERRFRTFSHGLAPITAPDNALILSSATPGRSPDDSKGQYSVLVPSCSSPHHQAAAAETIFNKTRVAISRASDAPRCRQCPRRCSKTSASA